MHKTQNKQLCTKTGKDNIHYAQLKSATQEKKKKKKKNKKQQQQQQQPTKVLSLYILLSPSLFFSSTS
jgi:hypothetical protein